MTNELSKNDIEVAISLLEPTPKYNNKIIMEIINSNRKIRNEDTIDSGRISEIRNRNATKNAKKKSHTKYIPYKKAKKSTVNEYLQTFESSQTPAQSLDPMYKDTLDKLFTITKKKPLSIDPTESNTIDYKQNFKDSIKKVIKHIIAFANTQGGYLVFGVEDTSGKVLGLNRADLKKFNEFDFETITTEIHNHIPGSIVIEKTTYKIKRKTLGIFYIPEHSKKPLILSRTKDTHPQGTILFRYPGKTTAIQPDDLEVMIEKRVKQHIETHLPKLFMEMCNQGLENIAIMNTQNGIVTGKGGCFELDENLLKDVQYIKEGEFSEKDGAPTIKIIGEAQSVNATNKTMPLEYQYPYPYGQILKTIKETKSDFTKHDLNMFIKDNGIKPPTVIISAHTVKKKSKKNVKLDKSLYNSLYCYFNEPTNSFSYNQAFIDYIKEKI